jgi:PAS domain S-box-containing protein
MFVTGHTVGAQVEPDMKPLQEPSEQQQAVQGLEVALDRMRLGFTVADVNGTILYSNPADARMHGYSVEELIGQNISVFAPPESRRPLTYEKLDQLQIWERETTNACKDGSLFPVRLISNVMRDASGHPLAVVTSCEDLTERRRVEQTIRDIEARLRQAQTMEAVGRLTGGIAHDFNNILTVITANAELISSSFSGGASDDDTELRELTAAALRGRAIIKQLMSVWGQGALTPEPLDPGEVVGELIPSVCSLLPDGIEVQRAFDDSLPNIHADRGALEQILLNLVTNARDAMGSAGILRFQTRLETLDEKHRASFGWGDVGEYVCISIADNGTGMDDHTREHIFDPFFTTKSVGKGTGLGMSVVYGFMKRQRGFIDVESQIGEGTTVKLYFPLTHERVKRDSAPAERLDLPQGTETILIVEDENPIRRAVARVLEQYGYTVLEAADGDEGLELFRAREHDIALVVTDVMMPRMSGPRLFQLIRQECSDTKFIFTTGCPSDDMRSSIALDPSVSCLFKPWTLSEFLMLVRKVLDEPQGTCS